MSTALWIILSIILAEIGYLLTYFITYVLQRFLFGVIIIIFALKRHPVLQDLPSVFGLIAGCCGCFAALFILLSIREYAGITAYWQVFISIGIIGYGQVQYIKYNYILLSMGYYPPPGWPGRLNEAASDVIKRTQFELYKLVYRPKFSDLIQVKPVKHPANEWVKKYMFRVSLATLVGILVGLPLYYWLIY